jgi:hypothetical protein
LRFQIRAALEQEEETQRRRHEAERQRQKEVLQYNAKYKAVVEEKERVQKTQDEFLLRYAMEREAESIATENAKKNANRAAAAQYRKYLEEQMIKEAEDNSTLDDIRRVEEEKVWNARDAALDARQRARDELRMLVDQGRMDQIEYRRRQQELEDEMDRIYAAQFIVDAKDGIRREHEEVQRRRELNLSNRSKLEEQIAYRRAVEERERQEAYLSDKHMRHMERVHQQKLQEQGGVVRTYRPLRQGQWYS